jgi:acyl carrier protein
VTDVRAALRQWVADRNDGLSPDDLDERTPLIEARYLTSLQVAELLLFLEELSGRPVDVAALRPGVFRDIETICETFLP